MFRIFTNEKKKFSTINQFLTPANYFRLKMFKIKSFCVAVALGLFAAVVSGCMTSSKSCKFPHAGDGGVLDKKGCYINGNLKAHYLISTFRLM